MSTLPKLAVGDTLTLRPVGRVNGTEQAVTVTKVGRKWAEARGSYSQTIRFDMRTGYEDCGDYPPRQRVLTAEMDAAEKRRRGALSALKSHGLTFEYSAEHRISTETIQRLVNVLDNP